MNDNWPLYIRKEQYLFQLTIHGASREVTVEVHHYNDRFKPTNRMNNNNKEYDREDVVYKERQRLLSSSNTYLVHEGIIHHYNPILYHPIIISQS